MMLGGAGGTFAVVEWADEGETSRERPIARLHLHREEVEAGAGEGVFVPRGTPHAYWNAVPSRTRCLLVMGPRTAQLVDEVHRPGATDFAALFERHDSELLA